MLSPTFKACKANQITDIIVWLHDFECHSCPFSSLGCVLSFEEVNSRTFTSLQMSYHHHSCDMHQVLLEATARFRTRQCNILLRREYRDNTVKHSKPDYKIFSPAGPQRSWENSKSLHPIKHALNPFDWKMEFHSLIIQKVHSGTNSCKALQA